MSKSLVFVILLFIPNLVSGQQVKDDRAPADTIVVKSIYRFDNEYRRADVFISSISSTLLVAAHYLQRDDLTEDDVINLTPEDISRFERGAVFNNSTSAQSLSDVLLVSSFVFPLAAAITVPDQGVSKTNLLFLYAQTVLVTNSLNVFTKVVSSRKRPYVYNPDVSLSQRTSRDALASFYSGHTVNVAAMTFLTAKILDDYYPESRLVDWVVWPLAAMLPAVQGYWRVQAGKHFISDVILGYGIGAVTGFMIPWLHHYERNLGTKKKNSKVSLKLQPFVGGLNGLSLTARF
ncbi:MAG: phosphatase PAP2 family protein [Candidatus Cyclobacteriaceae bacterium M2_1C_046]